MVGAVVGAAAVLVAVLAVAHARGTDLGELWEAVVVFRGDAARVIAESATGSTTARLAGLLGALAASGAPLLAVVLLRSWRRPAAGATDLRVAALAVLGWELVVVLLGGSYWLHYLVGLVPGLVLVAATATASDPGSATPRSWRTAYALAAVSSVVAVGWIGLRPIERIEAPAIAYLQQHVEPGDTGLVAFGAANIVQAAGLESPYPDLWSLPVRVRDPDLQRLARVLAGPDRPTWLVLTGTSLGTWGIDPTAAEPYLARHYTLVARTGDFTIYRIL
ncbi:unannotated protein [freshwater metagenome]|uniref:Unannotated protein n=1 Tax=freshwater metagenome TaxID=449393 RepID=A0A6J6PYL0_9ZZZZ